MCWIWRGFRRWRPEYADAEFITEDDGRYLCGAETEKMSKSKYNVVNPDDVVENYGADTLRLYEMFLGPLEQSKPWKTEGISGVSGFLKKMWKLYFGPQGPVVTEEKATPGEWKSLHKVIKKVSDGYRGVFVQYVGECVYDRGERVEELP